MHVSIIQAGTLLARLGRPEVENCIKGLQQYAYAYEECLEQANEIARQYTLAAAGDVDLNHMASVLRQGSHGLPDASAPQPPTTMAVPMGGDSGIGMDFNPGALAGGYRA